MDDTCYSSTDDDSMKDCEFYFSDKEESDDISRVDPRLLRTLESFKEIYDEKRDLLKKMFVGLYNEFVDVFKKLGEMMEKNKEGESMEQSRTVERSLSIGDEFVDEKFKVKPPTVILSGSDGKGGQTVQGNGK